MTNYKVYRITGKFIKPQSKVHREVPLMMEVRASSPEVALERVFSEIGSRHKVKRSEIRVPKDGGIVEITKEEAKSMLFTNLDTEDFVIYKE